MIGSNREERIDRKITLGDLDKKINNNRVWNYRKAIVGKNNEKDEGMIIKAIWA